MKLKTLSPYIYVLHSDIKKQPLFEGLWAIPQGVTLNSYIVQGTDCNKKTALIDLSADWQEAVDLFNSQLAFIKEQSKITKIDYLILNHLEGDHTGHLRDFIKQNPDTTIVATAKGINLVKNFLKVFEVCPTLKTKEIKDGDTLDLCGTVLTFFEIPNVHWPETMATYEAKSKVLFCCDAFGGYGATGDKIFDSDFSTQEHQFFEQESLKYYATIVASFSAFVNKALEKLTPLDIKAIAPSHGIIWKDNPKEIIQRYAKYAGFNTQGKCYKQITAICGSMYGNTKKGLDSVIKGIQAIDRDIKINVFCVPQDDIAQILASAYSSAGILVACPTYEYKLFPPLAYILDLFCQKHYINKTALRIGAYGWLKDAAAKDYTAKTQSLKWQQIPQYEWQGVPSDIDLQTLQQRGKDLATSVLNMLS